MAFIGGQLARGLRWRLHVLVPGAYAWGATVLWPALDAQHGVLAGLTAAVALVGLALGAWLAGGPSALGRWLSIGLFFGFSALTWVLVGRQSLAALDRIQSALGALGWLLFAMGWGTLRDPAAVPEEDPRALLGPPLPARRRLPRRSRLWLSLSVVCAGAVLAASWAVRKPEAALLAQAVALLAAVALLVLGANLALFNTRQAHWATRRARVGRAGRGLGGLAFAVMVGLLVRLLSG